MGERWQAENDVCYILPFAQNSDVGVRHSNWVSFNVCLPHRNARFKSWLHFGCRLPPKAEVMAQVAKPYYSYKKLGWSSNSWFWPDQATGVVGIGEWSRRWKSFLCLFLSLFFAFLIKWKYILVCFSFFKRTILGLAWWYNRLIFDLRC